MKKLIALVIVAVMLLGMMPMMALAADTIYYVTGEDLDPAWGWNAAAQKMEKEGDVYTYTVPYVFPRSKSYEYKITKGDWSWGCPSSGNNSITVSELSSVKITYNPTTNTASAEATPLTDYSTESITLHVNAAAMTSGAPYLWAWKQDGTNLYSDWPGKVIPADEYNGGWYTISMGWDYIGFLINNGASSNTVQTANVSAYAGQELWITVDSNKVVTKSFSAPSGWKTADDTYVITLDLGYEGCADASTLITTDGKITLPADPSRENYTFNGWFTKAEGGEPVDDDTVYTGSTTIYAQWTPNQPAVVDYYLIGYINGANYGCEGDSANMGTYKFVNGKLTVTFTADSYVFVKTTNNANWYMTDGYPGDTATSAVFYNTTANIQHNKLKVPANTEVEFTLNVNSANDTLTLSYEPTNAGGGATPPADPTDFYLVGYINGNDYGIEADIANLGDYKFVDGKVTVTFISDSYVQVKDNNKAIYGPAEYCTDKTASMVIGGGQKMFVPKGEVTFELVVNTDGTVKLSYTVDAGEDDDDDEQGGGSVTPPATEDTYIVAGTTNLCGTEWDPSNTANKMTKQSDGTYTITYNNVEAGNYAFKVTDGTWNNAWPGENYIFGVTATGDVTIAFNPNTKAVTVEGDTLGVYVPAEPTYIVAGSAGLCGAEWAADNADNKMTKNGDVYTITYTDVAPGNYEFKVTDGTWTNSWPGSNYTFGVTATGDVTITFNPETKEITVTGDTLGEYVPEDDDDDEQGGGSVTPPPTTEMITVHAKVPTDWEAAYLYAWSASPYKTWPGAEMAKGSEGWWTVKIPANMENIIATADSAGPQTVDKSITDLDGDVIWIILGEKNPDGYYLAEVTDTKPSSFKDEYAGNYVPPAAPTDFYLVGYINGADYYETTHKFVNGKLTITLTADSYAMIKDNNGDVYGTAAYCTEKTANMAIGGGEKMFVPKGEITFTLTVNADGTVKLSYTVPTPEGGNEGGNQGGTEGGNQSGTTGNPEVPTGSLIIHAKVPAAWASAYLYAWNTGDDVMASWPGTAMTKGDDGWYTIEIPAGYKNIIVAEKNGGEQTVDLSIANVTGNEIWVTLGEKNSDGKYPATIAEDEKGEEVVAPPEVKQITVYAKVPANWTTPYVYAWNGSGNNASWPGVAMTKGENGWWYAKVPATAENVIISNNGKTQTVDLKLEKLSVDAFVQVAAAGADGKYTATVQYSTNPDTGDTAIIAPVVFLMVMSVTGLAVLTVGKKKYF